MTVSMEDLGMLANVGREWIDEHMPLRAGRHAGDWRAAIAAIGSLGWPGVALDDASGGSGFGFTGLCRLLHAAGRELADTPLLWTAIAAGAIARHGTDTQKAAWLARLATGQAIATVAIGEGPHHAIPGTLSATRDGGWLLQGTKSWVPGADQADLILVTAQAAEPALFLVEPSSVRVEAIDSIDSRRFATVTADDLVLDDVAACIVTGREAVDHVVALARIGLAAEMLGAAERALEIVISYLCVREQFGQPIGSFQALQHRAAQMLVELELARSCVDAACADVDEDRTIVEPAIVAKAAANRAIHLISSEMVQMHGGIGMTMEHPAGNYLRWARISETLFGNGARLGDEFAALNGF